MGVIGTFGSFTTARLGIYASQASLNVTGNNIANINTKGYTRQRMDLVSLNSTGTAKYANPMGVDIGYGVLCKSTSQLRDPYLDIRYRNENSKLGATQATLDGLTQLAHTLDEVNKGGVSQNGVIENALQEFKTSLEGLMTNVGSEEYDGLVRGAADSVVSFFRTAAENLQTVWDNQADELRDTVEHVNTILTNIRDLNVQIRTQGIYGDLALELRDARNLAIDELSQYMHINVEYSMEKIDQYTEVEKLTVSLADTKGADGKPIKLIDGIFGGQISISKEPKPNPNYDPKNTTDASLPNYGKYLREDGTGTNYPERAEQIESQKFLMQVEPLYDQKGRLLNEGKHNESKMEPLTDTDLSGALQAMRELLTEEGEYASKEDLGLYNGTDEMILRGADPEASIKKGIPYYQKMLDCLAQKFAKTFNDANQLPATTVYQTMKMADPADATKELTVFADKDGQPIKDADGNFITIDDVTEPFEVKDDQGNVVDTIRVPKTNGEPRTSECLAILRDKAATVEGYEDFYDGGVLFSNSGNNDDPSGITASNISIAKSWADRIVRVLNTTRPNEGGITHSSRNDNIQHMITLFEKQLDYMAKDVEPDANGERKFFHGSFQEMYTDIGATLGEEMNILSGINSNYELMTLDLDNDRSSVSGVDLNDEATSMMQFQKSYQAACRLLTTIDSMLDTLINGTAR